MDAKKVFSQVMLERHTNYKEVAAKLGMNTQSLLIDEDMGSN